MVFNAHKTSVRGKTRLEYSQTCLTATKHTTLSFLFFFFFNILKEPHTQQYHASIKSRAIKYVHNSTEYISMCSIICLQNDCNTVCNKATRSYNTVYKNNVLEALVLRNLNLSLSLSLSLSLGLVNV